MSAAAGAGGVAVVIPAYDAARYLAEALESALAQRPAPAEVVVVDDGSGDATAEVARAFEARGVRLLRQENRGPAVARNAGVTATTAPLLAFLDADDVWPERSLAARLEAFAADPSLDGVAGHVECFPSPDADPEALARLAAPELRGPTWLAGAVLVRRAAFERVGPFDASLRVAGEFIDWMGRARALGLSLGRIDALVLRRRVHPSSMTVRAGGALAQGYLAAAKAALARRRARGPGSPTG